MLWAQRKLVRQHQGFGAIIHPSLCGFKGQWLPARARCRDLEGSQCLDERYPVRNIGPLDSSEFVKRGAVRRATTSQELPKNGNEEDETPHVTNRSRGTKIPAEVLHVVRSAKVFMLNSPRCQ